MITPAFWVVEQEYFWFKRNLSPTRENSPHEIAAIPFYIVTGVPIAATPYAQLVVAWDSARAMAAGDWYNKLHRQAGYKVGRRRIARVAIGKIGSRFIPYVGWALLVVDLWALGKWIGEKTS